MNPKISIIVPVYKVEKYLERCVSSLLGQTLQEIEILLIDDASPDRSPKMCDAFRKKDERITVIHKPVNQGLALARNTGIEHARGKYLLFVDSDDFVETEMCRKLYEKAEETGADTVLFSVNYIMGNGKVIDYHTNDGKEEIFKGNEVMEKYFPEVLGAEPSRKTDYNFGMHPGSILLKKSVLTENNIRFISERTYIYEDMTFLFLYYPHVKKVLVYPEIFYHYCMNEGSLTTTVDVNRFERVKKMHGYLMEQYGSNLLKKENLRLRYQRIMLSYIRLCVMQLPLSLEGYRKVRMIGRSDFTKDVFRDYPIRKLPLKQRIFAYLLKYRLSFANLLLTAVYQKVR